ncbi:MAG TPA: chemotaxis protein CheA [Polyangiales bacterium]|nr:chemotaxis protein CheA [Polyangiales bacterium]
MNLEEQLRELFVEEAGDALREFEQSLLLLESLPDDPDLVGKLFRGVHTLKGNSRILGFANIEHFAHDLENLLDSLRRHELIVNEQVADVLLRCLDVLKELVAEVGGGAVHNADNYRAAGEGVRKVLAQLGKSEQPEAPMFELPDEPTRVSLAAAMYRSNPSPPSVRPADSPVPSLRPPSLRPPTVIASTPPSSEAKHEVLIGASEPPPPPKPVSAKPARAKPVQDAESNSVRVPIDKLDRLINLTGEVVIAQSIIAQLVNDLTPERVGVLQEVVAQMDRHCRELQERMLGARMLPLRNVFTRFHRLVRDLAGTTGKAMRLEVSGEETELDKTVIEKISDPLTHLIRNAVDHGIETPEQRRLTGKPEQACVRLEAYQKGGNIFIEVSDDGRGIDRERVLNKAVEQGLIKAGTAMSDEEVYQLIFHAGFSTAEKVTEISGRGVGMDVVKRNVEALKGSIQIQSEPGLGTCFRVKLPLTLAILDGLGVRVGSEIYLVPLVSVVESLQPKPSDVHELPHAGEVVDVRGEYLPLVRLHRLFDLAPSFESPHEGLVMVIDDGSRKLALQIDELIGQYQVVIKSLETNFQAVPGIAGATVLGDGRVALILDTGNLANVVKNRPPEQAPVELIAESQP